MRSNPNILLKAGKEGNPAQSTVFPGFKKYLQIFKKVRLPFSLSRINP
jgi:hypothetical protein